MYGDLLLGIGLFTALSGSIILLCGSDDYAVLKKCVKVAVYITALAASLASAYLMYLIFSNDFSFAYVASYSSIELPFIYKVSAFWAGQQGSFLLWIFIHCVAGGYMQWKNTLSSKGMAVYLLLASFLLVLTLGKSPFEPAEFIGADGIGMNPLLQDPWMAIHPPVVFLGYALLAIPFAAGMGALLENLPNKVWLETARKATLVAWSCLGAGIFIGGYWAYKVLGWGGYWGWDPVENSSLVPWLLAGVYLHLLKVSRIRPSLVSTVHLAGIFTYGAVIYGTFLTRSGILGDFSVHSFSGTTIGLMLAVVNGAIILASLLILCIKANNLPKGKLYDSFSTREFLILLGMMIMMLIAVVVFIGMSMPLLTQLAGKAAAVDNSFYEKLCTPLAICLLIAMLLASWYGYGKENTVLVVKGRPLAFGIALLGVGIAFVAGVSSPLALILSGAAAMAVFASCQAYQRKIISWGGFIAHLGVTLGLLAMMLSGSGSKTVNQEIAAGDGVEALGYSITYKGQEVFSEQDYKEYVYEVDGREVRALTKLRKSGEDAAREPAIYRGFMGDLYLAPSPAHIPDMQELTLEKGKTEMDEVFAYRYEAVEMIPSQDNPQILVVKAKFAITDGEAVEEAYPTILATETGATSKPIDIMDGKKQIRLTGISGDQLAARIEVLPSKAEIEAVPVSVSISNKPFIWLLWLSIILVTVGCLGAVFHKKIK